MDLSKKRLLCLAALGTVLVAGVVGIILAVVLPSPPTDAVNPPAKSTVAPATPSVTEQERVDCYPEAEGGLDQPDRERCLSRGCEWLESGMPGAPPCFIPGDGTSGHGYSLISQTETALGFQIILKRRGVGLFGENIENIQLDVEYRGDNMIRFKVGVSFNVYQLIKLNDLISKLYHQFPLNLCHENK